MIVCHCSRFKGRLTLDRAHFRECLRETLSEMFGADTVTETIRGEKLDLVVNEKVIVIDLATLVRKVEQKPGSSYIVQIFFLILLTKISLNFRT